MKIEIKKLQFRERVLTGARAFEKIKSLSNYLYDNFFNGKRVKNRFSKGACLAISEQAAINILSAVALDENRNGCANIKFIVNRNLFYVQLCNMRNGLYIDILEIENQDGFDITFLKNVISVNLLTQVMSGSLSLRFIKVKNRETLRGYGALVELTTNYLNKKVFIAKKQGKYILVGKNALYDIEIDFNPQAFYKKDIATKQGVRGLLCNVNTSFQNLMFLWR